MTIKHVIPAAALAAALATAPTFAATQGGRPTTEVTPQKTATAPPATTPVPAHPTAMHHPFVQRESLSDRVDPADIAAFASAKIPLDQAIASAERDLHGTAVEAGFKATPDQPHYVVWVMANGRVTTGWVDAQSGAVKSLAGSTSLRRVPSFERAEFAATGRARTNLAEAARTAQAKSGDKAIAASFEISGRTRAYEVTIVKGMTPRTVWVSPRGQAHLASR